MDKIITEIGEIGGEQRPAYESRRNGPKFVIKTMSE